MVLDSVANLGQAECVPNLPCFVYAMCMYIRALVWQDGTERINLSNPLLYRGETCAIHLVTYE